MHVLVSCLSDARSAVRRAVTVLHYLPPRLSLALEPLVKLYRIPHIAISLQDHLYRTTHCECHHYYHCKMTTPSAPPPPCKIPPYRHPRCKYWYYTPGSPLLQDWTAPYIVTTSTPSARTQPCKITPYRTQRRRLASSSPTSFDPPHATAMTPHPRVVLSTYPPRLQRAQRHPRRAMGATPRDPGPSHPKGAAAPNCGPLDPPSNGRDSPSHRTPTATLQRARRPTAVPSHPTGPARGLDDRAVSSATAHFPLTSQDLEGNIYKSIPPPIPTQLVCYSLTPAHHHLDHSRTGTQRRKRS